MADIKLIIGSKTLSSWSLRPWLLLRYHNVAFKEVCIPLDTPETREKILEYSPSGKVPALINGTEKVWDSLAICEYAAEILKLSGAWPADTAQRHLARSLACEMHSGFVDLRNELPMDCRRAPSPHPLSQPVLNDIARIREIWRECRELYGRGGDWLFGKFGIVDAMYAPVALRFHSYAVPLDGPELEYKDAVLNLPALREWLGAAMLESTTGRAPVPAAAHPAKPVEKPTEKTLKQEPLRPAATPAPKPAPAPKAAASPSKPSASGSKLVSKGGMRVTSNIIPD